MNYLRLIDNDGNVFNFPNDFYLKDNSWNVSQNIKNIAFAAGGRDISDGFLTARSITIEGYIRADNLSSLEVLERQIQKSVLNGGRLYVVGDVVNRYMIVSSPQVESNYINDYLTEKKYDITYLVEYPFWQAANETEYSNILSGVTGGNSFVIDNSDSDFLVYPVIQVLANQGVDIPYFRLINQSDGGMFCEYRNSDFVSGDTLVIDSFLGTVKKNGNSSIEYFETPRFLRVQNNVNTFLYEGVDAEVIIIFRKVYL